MNHHESRLNGSFKINVKNQTYILSPIKIQENFPFIQ